MEELERDRLVRLIDVGRGLMSELDREALLARILDVARELTGARYAALGILDDRRETLERFLTVGIDESIRATIGELPRGRGVLGELIRDPRPLRLGDVALHPRSYGFPIGHPEMRSFLGAPILLRGEAWGNLYLTEKEDGGDFSVADEQALVVLADWAAIAIENARLYRGVRERRDELEHAVRSLEATSEITRAVGGELELERILELIAKRGRALVGARTMLIALTEGEVTRIAAAAGQGARELHGLEAPAQESIGGYAVRTRRAQRLSSAASGLRTPWADRVGASAGLVVPLLFRDRPLGVIAAFDRLEDGPEFSAEDEALMRAFGASAAMAVATGQHVVAAGARQRLEASERERARWARELHDETLQELGALKLLLAAARRGEDIETLRRALDRGVDHLTEGIARLRALITDLRPAALDQLGTVAALEALTARVRAQAGVEIALRADLAYEGGRAPTRHTPELEATLYRVVQEALTNAVKHARASALEVELRERDGAVELAVRDNGRGFDTAALTAGFGLVGMEERIALVRGALEIRSAPGVGTEVVARIPAERRPEADEPPAAVARIASR